MKIVRDTIAVVATFLLLICNGPLVNSLTPEQIVAIEKLIYTEFMPHGHVPGMSISIVHDGDVYSSGHGYRNREQGLAVTNETHFAVGSLSKMLSATYITHMLHEKFSDLGDHVLDIPIRQLAPNFNLILSDRYRTEKITFRDILSHKVCLVDIPLYLYAIAGGSNKTDTVYQRRYAPEFCHFRDIQISYSNLMIHVAGEAAAAVVGDGSSYEDLATAFFRSIGMNNTRFVSDTDDYESLDFAKPYYWKDGQMNRLNPEFIKRVGAIPAAGGVFSNSNDLATYINLMLNRGKVAGVQVLNEEVIDSILRISTRFRFDGYRTYPGEFTIGSLGYGLGMFLDLIDGFQSFGHMGLIEPYSSLVQMMPALKIGIFTTTSSGPLYPEHLMLQYKIMAMLLDFVPSALESKTFSELSMREAELLRPQKEFLKGSAIKSIDSPTPQNTRVLNHSDLVGTYGQVLQGDFQISNVNETTLYFRMGRWATGYLHQRYGTPTIYDLEFDSDITGMFYLDPYMEVPVIYIDFSTPNSARISYDMLDYLYVKDWSLEHAPVIPWDPTSCGPQF